MKRFDPPQDLTLTEVTQLLREIFQDIPSDQALRLVSVAPTLAQYMVDEPEIV